MPMSAATASASVTNPNGASTTKTALTASEATTLTRMIERALLAVTIASGRRSRRSLISATSALWSAASLPAAPMAMPTCAAARAGASLTPSPTIATGPLAAELFHGGELVLRQQTGAERVEPRVVRDRAGDGLGVAGEHHDLCDAGVVQPGGQGRRLGPELVGQPEEREHPVALAERDRGLAGSLKVAHLRRQLADAILDEPWAAGPTRHDRPRWRWRRVRAAPRTRPARGRRGRVRGRRVAVRRPVDARSCARPRPRGAARRPRRRRPAPATS